MPRIRPMLADGKVVRVPDVGPLICLKQLNIVGKHAEYDTLWLDQEPA